MDWSLFGDTQSIDVTISNSTTVINHTVGTRELKLTVAGENPMIIEFDVASQIYRYQILFPIRVLTELAGASVEWIPYTRTVVITSP